MSFFRALFDFQFKEFVVTKVIKILYLLTVIALAIGSLILLVVGLIQIGQPARLGGGAGWLLSIIVVPILFVLALIAVRIYFELTIFIFLFFENIRDITFALTKGQKAPVAMPAVPQPPYQPFSQPPQPPQYPQPPQPPQYPQYPQYPQNPQQPGQ